MADPVPEHAEATDRTLLRRVREGESEAATLLYDRYARRLLALAAARTGRDLSARLDPEDVLQSVFRTFFRRAARGEYDLPDGANLWGLLAVIAVNKVRAKGAYHRAASRNVGATTGKELLRDVTEDDETALADLQLTIDEILGGLPETQRAIIRHRIAGEPVADIAQKTGRSKRSVERAIQDFCRTLRGMLEPESP
jgi:RNA polymerase sigma factor (sigma-70 family)